MPALLSYLIWVHGFALAFVVGNVGEGSIYEPHGLWFSVIISVTMSVVAIELMSDPWQLHGLALQVKEWATFAVGAWRS